eukprot:scaffold684_cov345-Pavlova_lutheri.AAC.7
MRPGWSALARTAPFGTIVLPCKMASLLPSSRNSHGGCLASRSLPKHPIPSPTRSREGGREGIGMGSSLGFLPWPRTDGGSHHSHTSLAPPHGHTHTRTPSHALPDPPGSSPCSLQSGWPCLHGSGGDTVSNPFPWTTAPSRPPLQHEQEQPRRPHARLDRATRACARDTRGGGGGGEGQGATGDPRGDDGKETTRTAFHENHTP